MRISSERLMILKKVGIIIFIIGLIFILLAPAVALSPENWNDIKGFYGKESKEPNRSEGLSLMYLDNDIVMFEFFMKSSVSEGVTGASFCLASAFIVDEKGIGIYEHPKTGDVKITFTLKENGVEVVQTGNLPTDLSGIYTFSKESIAVTEQAAIQILEQLAPAATGLNAYNSDYMLDVENDQVDGWFYSVKAYTKGTKDVFAEFYIAADMSSVYRVDTDVPILIWGSAQTLVNSTYKIPSEALYGATAAAETANVLSTTKEPESEMVVMDYVVVALENATLAVGEKTNINVKIPGNLQYTIDYESLNPDIANVDENGTITVLSDAECAIKAIITIDDAQKTIDLTVNPEKDNAEISISEGKIDAKMIITFALIVSIIVAILLTFVLLKLKLKIKPKIKMNTNETNENK